MRKKTILLIGLTIGIVGCAKKNQEVIDINDIPLPLPQPEPKKQEQSKIQVATGEMKEILLTLKRVHFSFDTSTLETPARDALDEASAKLTKLPEVSLYVDGHTDERGTTEYNLSLGEQRAQTVVSYLTDLGVETARLNHVSFGEEMPLSHGTGEVDHAQNRRVDFRLFKGDIEFVLEDSPLLNDKGNIIAHAD